MGKKAVGLELIMESKRIEHTIVIDLFKPPNFLTKDLEEEQSLARRKSYIRESYAPHYYLDLIIIVNRVI